MEYSDRGKYVTEQVSLWIVNDGEYVERARVMAKDMAGEFLAEYLYRVVRDARPYSAAWQVGQELAANDYTRVDWVRVAEELRGEE